MTTEFKIKNYYYNDENFRSYVDKYRSDRKISLEEALTHKIVKEIYFHYKEADHGSKK